RYLILKLLAINLVVIGFVMILVWVVIDTLAAGYFVTLMEKYNISPKPAHAMFVDAIHRYLLWVSLAAVVLSVILSYLMMRRVLAPLTQMSAITREIAAGNFALRVPAITEDEVGQLARAFNRMSESLEKIENLRHKLMIDVAHELRTPLTNIRGYLEALNDAVLPPSSKTFSMLQNETLRIVQLVEDVLQLAKADAAHDNLKFENVDLVEMIDDIRHAYRHAMNERSIHVHMNMPSEPVFVSADRNRLARVFRNLADNVVRYTPPAGAVMIHIEPGPETIRICFKNPAEGLTTKDLPYLFERFYRGEKSRSRQHGGAGIGLAIVKELIEAHKGVVDAELREGQLCICVELPRISHQKRRSRTA
ncbi:MAG: HAMP domain-containing protein, partial [Deltaproteobacteria bacterium]|nr:HAMP domain-containing protein [Deltaproteobacteria bacterium]